MTGGHAASLVTTSWDDGHPLDLRVAELLVRYGLTATFYIPRSVGWPTMTAKEMGELASRFEVGSHTLDHTPLTRVPDKEALDQLLRSREWIEDVTGKPCRVFCFPRGQYRQKQLSLVRAAGYRSARTVELLSTNWPRRVAGLAIIPTTVQAYPHSPLAYSKNALKRRSLVNLFHAGALFSSRDWCELGVKLLERTLSQGGVFHLWGHSWEIEQEHQWDRLEELLAFIATNKDQLTCMTNSELGSYAY
ncbi:MAG TPA: polysaccharide deacetylase family protein [Candidatus Bathyarchaeia archaeon]|nr:polysaccharide deacetylase family protein [Candidatus Bathyarchaeia archaeon]